MLETTPVSVDSALQRAHKAVDERLPERSQQATLRSLSDSALRQVVQRYVAAWERSDVNAVVAMLAEDAKLVMPPLPAWYRGREQVAIFLGGGPLAGATRWRLIPARANGQVAFGLYAWDDKTQAFLPRAVDVLTLRGAQILQITAFLTPGAFAGFGFPGVLDELPAADHGQFGQQVLHPGPVLRDVGELDVLVAANEVGQPGDLDGALVGLGA